MEILSTDLTSDISDEIELPGPDSTPPKRGSVEAVLFGLTFLSSRLR